MIRPGARNRPRRRVRRSALVALWVLLGVVVGGLGYAYYVTHDLRRIVVKGLHGAITTGSEAGSENILMMGSTSHCALTVQNPAYGLCQVRPIRRRSTE